ncbi:hemerythrin domain-containing protein [Brevibacterium spongiae]|uniref:Hemerythrin domain-containing protein n=1 Tax=Brevibacterium spongiae TaxID=2909672 RepID=A0ABY5SKJ6_9MICO|nr:hemerythrin domain-containing protein [Brevibacterium spongiae]UVI35055.1 hemerythrin domain-containing protein [Brevibacterium spongiae]
MTDSAADESAGLSVGEVLERDHHRIDGYFEKFAQSLSGDGPIDVEAFTTGAAGLRHHIYVEEVLHFPAMKAGGLMGPVFVMLREHGELWDRMDEIASKLEAGASSGEIAAPVWEALETGLEAHNDKEEKILYPAGDDLLTADLGEEILETLANPDIPEGWTCEMSGRS